MKAIVQDIYGGPEVLELRDIDVPVPAPDEVLIRVEVASAHIGDWHLMTGVPYLLRFIGFGLRAPKKQPGMDVAGVVESVGREVTAFAPGDEVFGVGAGAFAEYCCAPADKLVEKPASLTFEAAATLPTSAVGALQAIRDYGNVATGHRVLVIGAGGAIGSFAVQWAKSFDAHVTGVCSTAKVDLVRSLGADRVVDYTQTDPADSNERYDVVLDTAGGRSLSALRRLLTPTGTLVLVGAETREPIFGGIGRMVRALVLSRFVRHNLRWLQSVDRLADLETVRDAAIAGTIVPAIGSTYPLAGVADAMRYLHDGHAHGKVVIAIA